MTLLLDLLPRSILARVQPLPFAVVDRLWGGRPKNGDRREQKHHDTFSSSAGSSFQIMLCELPKANQTILKLKMGAIPGLNMCEYVDYVS